MLRHDQKKEARMALPLRLKTKCNFSLTRRIALFLFFSHRFPEISIALLRFDSMKIVNLVRRRHVSSEFYIIEEKRQSHSSVISWSCVKICVKRNAQRARLGSPWREPSSAGSNPLLNFNASGAIERSSVSVTSLSVTIA